MTTFVQQVNAPGTEEIFGYPVQFNTEEYSFVDSDTLSIIEDRSLDLIRTLGYGIGSQQDLIGENYRMCEFYLASNLVVGPTEYGAGVVTGYGTELFFSDPRLPVDLWVGPIRYIIASSNTQTFGFSAINAGSAQDSGNATGAQVWSFTSRPFYLAGVIPKGGRLALLQKGSENLHSSFTSLYYPGYESNLPIEALVDFESGAEVSVSPSESAEHSRLPQQIRAVHRQTALEDDVVERAQRAVDDACTFAAREIPHEKPLVMLSDDGVVILQWRNTELGVLLIFTGDGTGNYSIKGPGGLYAGNNVEFVLADGLPAEIRSTIERIVST